MGGNPWAWPAALLVAGIGFIFGALMLPVVDAWLPNWAALLPAQVGEWDTLPALVLGGGFLLMVGAAMWPKE